MSTPNLLDREALSYLDALGPGHRRLLLALALTMARAPSMVLDIIFSQYTLSPASRHFTV